MRKTFVTLSAAAALLVCASVLAHEPAAKKIAKGTAIIWPASEVKWTPLEALPGAQVAALWGDIATGEHGALYKWPAGTTAPLHWHTNGEHGVIVSGTLALTPEGGAAKELSAGSYFSMAGGAKHVTACTAATDCVFFIHREGKFDVNMVGAAETKK